MPTYEYRCLNGHGFEEFFLKMSDAKSELPCPTCGARGDRHLSVGSGLVFKGSGFYITDYGKDGKKAFRAAKSDAARAEATKADAGTSDAGKSDASKSDASKSDAGKREASKSDAGKSDAGKSDAGRSGKSAPAKADKAPSASAPTKSASE